MPGWPYPVVNDSGNIYASAYVERVDIRVVEGLPRLTRKHNKHISYKHGRLEAATGGYREGNGFKIYRNKS